MKSLFLYSILLISLISCETELVQWEFVRSPSIDERGDFTSSGLSIHKNISKSDIIDKLDFKFNDGTLKTLKINSANVILNLPNVPQADSIKFELFCDAIPFEPTHIGVVAIKPGLTVKILNEEKIKLGPVSFPVISLLNNTLDGVINKGNIIKFNLIARAIPSGALINGSASVLINFDATIWKCIQKPELTIFSDENKGPCQ